MMPKIITIVGSAISLLVGFAICLQDCKKGSTKMTYDIPKRLKAHIEVYNLTNKDVVQLEYFRDEDRNLTAILQHTRSSPNLLFIQNSEHMAFVDGSLCKLVTVKDMRVWPMLINPQIDSSWSQGLWNLHELLKRTKNTAFDLISTLNETDSVKFQFLTTCENKTQAKGSIRYNLETRVDPYKFPDSQVKDLPESIGIIVTDSDVETTNILFRLSGLSSQFMPWEERMFFPPMGTDCRGFNDFQPKIEFPSNFSVVVDYLDLIENYKETSRIYLDSGEQILSFDFTKKLAYRPLSSYDWTLNQGSYRIVHDFNTGLQYVLNRSDEMACVKVESISEKCPDVENGKIPMSMKNAFNLLVTNEANVNFSWIGKKMLLDIPYDIFTVSESNSSSVWEVWTTNQTVENTLRQYLPTVLRIYKTQGENLSNLIMEQKFYDWKIFDEKMDQNSRIVVQRSMANIKNCMNLVQNLSYLVVQLTAENDISTLNTSALEIPFLKKMANIANVSLLRVNQFYYQPVNKSDLFVFFTLAEKSSVNGTATVNFKPEIQLKTAYDNLNETLQKNQVEVYVHGTKLWALKNSLNFVPPYFANASQWPGPIPDPHSKHSGYTGGSMAALALFMLALGAVGGFGLAFFLWKRNRGIQYQIYE